jgi:hypothetical protein
MTRLRHRMSVLLLSAATMSCAAAVGVSTPAGAAVAGSAGTGAVPVTHLGCGHPAGIGSGGPQDTLTGPDPASGWGSAAPVLSILMRTPVDRPGRWRAGAVPAGCPAVPVAAAIPRT